MEFSLLAEKATYLLQMAYRFLQLGVSQLLPSPYYNPTIFELIPTDLFQGSSMAILSPTEAQETIIKRKTLADVCVLRHLSSHLETRKLLNTNPSNMAIRMVVQERVLGSIWALAS